MVEPRGAGGVPAFYFRFRQTADANRFLRQQRRDQRGFPDTGLPHERGRVSAQCRMQLRETVGAQRRGVQHGVADRAIRREQCVERRGLAQQIALVQHDHRADTRVLGGDQIAIEHVRVWRRLRGDDDGQLLEIGRDRAWLAVHIGPAQHTTAFEPCDDDRAAILVAPDDAITRYQRAQVRTDMAAMNGARLLGVFHIHHGTQARDHQTDAIAAGGGSVPRGIGVRIMQPSHATALLLAQLPARHAVVRSII